MCGIRHFWIGSPASAMNYLTEVAFASLLVTVAVPRLKRL
jgi:hypothetical protein